MAFLLLIKISNFGIGTLKMGFLNECTKISIIQIPTSPILNVMSH